MSTEENKDMIISMRFASDMAQKLWLAEGG